MGKKSQTASNKGLKSRIHKEVKEINKQKTNDSIKTWAKDMNRYFSKEDIQTDNEHEKMFIATNDQRNVNQNHN